MMEDALGRVARFEERRPKLILAVFLVITIILVSGFSLIQTETDFESQVPEDIQAIQALNEIRDKLGGGSASIILMFSLDPEDPESINDIRQKEVLETMSTLRTLLLDDEFVTGSRSMLDIVDPGQSQNEINAALDSNPAAQNLVSRDRRITIAVFELATGMTFDEQGELLAKTREIVQKTHIPPGVKVDIAGGPALSEEIGNSLGGSIGFVTSIGFVGVFVAIYVFFRRKSYVMISIIPIIIATLWTYGTLGFIGIPLSTQLTGVFSIIIGLGIDFAIHILHRFNEDKKRYRKFETAVYNAVQHVGKGLTMTSVTTIIGFMALLFATLPLLRDFSIALTFGVLYSLVAAIGVIPPILVLIERRSLRKQARHRQSEKKAREQDAIISKPSRSRRTTGTGRARQG